MNNQILVCDDDASIREVINILLSSEGYNIVEAIDGEDALSKIKNETFDLIILDIMMPKLDGYHSCMEIRKYSNVPILFLSAKGQDSDKTLGFSSGGDDYLVKPFSYNELTGRVKALLRRYKVYQGSPSDIGSNQDILEINGLMIDFKNKKVTHNEREIILTDIETSLLRLFVTHRGQIYSLEEIYQEIWNDKYFYGAGNTVMVHIRNLRKKLETDDEPSLIRTIWGKGYCCD